MTRIELACYGQPAASELSWEQVSAIRRAAQGRVAVTASDHPGSWAISGTGHVGTIAVAGVQVLVRPNIPPANLFHLLESGREPLDVGPEMFEYERTRDLLPSFATFFARVVERAFAQGMYRSYEERDEFLVGPRGRIDVVAQQRIAGLPVPVACRFDEHTLDVPVNRLIKAAAHRLLFVPDVTAATRRALSGLLVRLEEVSALQGSELRVETTFTRLNQHLAGAERLARIVLGGTTIADRIGDVAAGVFMVHMPTLFEDFVTDRLRRHLRGRFDVVAQDRRSLTAPASPVRRSIRPDLVFRRSGGDCAYVGDVKYKLDNDARARDGDVYQLLAYTTALGPPEGVLVYCRDTPGDRVGELHVARTGKRLFAYPIEIGGSPAQLERELAQLAVWVDGRIGPTLPA